MDIIKKHILRFAAEHDCKESIMNICPNIFNKSNLNGNTNLEM